MKPTDIYSLIQDELAHVEANLRSLKDSGSSHISDLLSHVTKTQGKRLRPAITILASKVHPGPSSNLPTLMATAVELLHIATLIHDDTVDVSATRRGRPTVSSIWGDHAAVLLGDYVFAASATFVCDTKNVRVIRRFSETIMELSKGELYELFGAFDWKQKRGQYYDRIYNKTASLFCTAAESGALLGNAPEDSVQALKDYGGSLGMAFQIVDDILDFQGVEAEVGKPVGSDLLHGTLTLPAIILQEQCPTDSLISNVFQDVNRGENLKKAVEMIHSLNIIEESYKVASDFCHKAESALQPLPPSPYKEALLSITEYVVQRRK